MNNVGSNAMPWDRTHALCTKAELLQIAVQTTGRNLPLSSCFLTAVAILSAADDTAPDATDLQTTRACTTVMLQSDCTSLSVSCTRCAAV